MIILNIEDFKEGKYKIPQTPTINSEKLESYIERYEDKYITDLLGAELSDLFIADLLDGVPQTLIYLNIFNPIKQDLKDECKIKRIYSRGIKDMLRGCIFWEFMRDLPNQKDLTGVNRAKSENGEPIHWQDWGLPSFYNESVSSFRSIQAYIEQNIVDYPTFNGSIKKPIYL
jgi:hypothetical protein